MTTTAQRLAELAPEQRQAVLSTMSGLELAALEYSWEFWRQPHQTPPAPPWLLWLLMAGRGAGKSWTATAVRRALGRVA